MYMFDNYIVKAIKQWGLILKSNIIRQILE